MPSHTAAERKKKREQDTKTFRRLVPGQFGADLIGKALKDIKGIKKKKKK